MSVLSRRVGRPLRLLAPDTGGPTGESLSPTGACHNISPQKIRQLANIAHPTGMIRYVSVRRPTETGS